MTTRALLLGRVAIDLTEREKPPPPPAPEPLSDRDARALGRQAGQDAIAKSHRQPRTHKCMRKGSQNWKKRFANNGRKKKRASFNFQKTKTGPAPPPAKKLTAKLDKPPPKHLWAPNAWYAKKRDRRKKPRSWLTPGEDWEITRTKYMIRRRGGKWTIDWKKERELEERWRLMVEPDENGDYPRPLSPSKVEQSAFGSCPLWNNRGGFTPRERRFAKKTRWAHQKVFGENAKKHHEDALKMWEAKDWDALLESEGWEIHLQEVEVTQSLEFCI